MKNIVVLTIRLVAQVHVYGCVPTKMMGIKVEATTKVDVPTIIIMTIVPLHGFCHMFIFCAILQPKRCISAKGRETYRISNQSLVEGQRAGRRADRNE